jgi:hypothetical protein
LDSLSKETGLPRERFFLVNVCKGEKSVGSVRFEPYSINFNRLMNNLSKKLQAKEKVSVVSFGGSATGCYKSISKPMVQALSKRFGKRLVNVQTALPFVYEKPQARKIKPKAWLRGLKKLLRHRKRV